MGLRPKDLNLSYHFSTWTQKAPHRVLASAANWFALIEAAKLELINRTKKAKPLVIIIIDRDATKNTKSGKNGNSKTKVCFHATLHIQATLSILAHYN